MEQEKFLSTAELAKILGISRIAVFKKIKEGKIKAMKVGRNFVIDRIYLPEILGDVLKNSDKQEIDEAVKKTVKEYGKTLKLLGNDMKNKIIKCRNINGEEFEVTADKLSFRPSVYAMIIKGGKILLSKQWDGYDFPGGGINLGETIEESVVRETKEETGFEIKVGKLVGCENSFFKFRQKEKYVQSILIYYLCEITGGEISVDMADEDEKSYIGLPEWIDLKDVAKIKFYNSIDSLKIIEEAIRKSEN